jgi:DNA invertase Pin-like site-specific DNA recombinase
MPTEGFSFWSGAPQRSGNLFPTCQPVQTAELAKAETCHDCNFGSSSAIDAFRKHKARLVIAKLDRLSRNLAFLPTLMDSGVEFVAVDNPHAHKLTIHVLEAVAEHEREAISERTKAALAAAKARGKRLGTPDPARRRRAHARGP